MSPVRVPVSWLKEYVEIDATAEELADRLTFSGMEVEGIETVGHSCEGVVAGEILSVAPHPGADRLKLCRVSDGASEYAVVCGAENFAAGDKAAFAPAGAVLPSGQAIREARIRGELSQGMLCAADELALSDDHAGILLLPGDTPPGTPLADLVGGTDRVLELEITWNRGDCLSLLGVAREVAALYGAALRRPEVDLLEVGRRPVDELVQVELRDAGACPRYTARVLTGVTLGPSPLWMQRRLSACGIRPINNVVDITNYVLLEAGHPLHAFDYARLRGGRIVVRRARAGECMATLDGQQRVLNERVLVIGDAGGPVALAGVMGGAGSEIGPATETVLLESACFAPPVIRAASSALGLATESSYRFERGVDIGAVEWASRRAAQLMVELAGAAVAPGVADAYPEPRAPRPVSCSFQAARDLIGLEIADGEIVDIFERLALPVETRTTDGCTVAVPTFRPDLEIEADLIEEVARIHGLDKLEQAAPACSVVPDADDSHARLSRLCRGRLAALGLTETMTYSFLSEELLDLVPASEPGLRVVLPNPVSRDYAVLRPSLLPQMAATLGHNLAHQVAEAACFEVGRVFLRQRDGTIGESERLCVGLMGASSAARAAGAAGEEEMFLRLKGVLEALLAAQKVSQAVWRPACEPWMRTGAEILAGGQRLGAAGLLAEKPAGHWRMGGPVALAELELEPLLEHAGELPELEPLPVYPPVVRDLALIADSSISHGRIVEAIWKSAPSELTEVRLFDIFRGEGLGSGKRSLAYSLTYRSPDRSLTDEDANGFHGRIKSGLRQELNIELRES